MSTELAMPGRCMHCSRTGPRNPPSAPSHMHTCSSLDALEAVLKLWGLSSSFAQLKPHKAHGHQSGQTPTQLKRPVGTVPECAFPCVEQPEGPDADWLQPQRTDGRLKLCQVHSSSSPLLFLPAGWGLQPQSEGLIQTMGHAHRAAIYALQQHSRCKYQW